MGEDIFERLCKSLLIMGGGFALLYLMITGTQTHPRGIALVVIRSIETVARCLMIFGLSVAGIFLALGILEYIRSKRRREIERIEKEKRVQLAREAAISESIKRENECQQTKIKQKQIEEEKRYNQERIQLEKESYLKTRSAEDAAKDALKHFM